MYCIVKTGKGSSDYYQARQLGTYIYTSHEAIPLSGGFRARVPILLVLR